MSRLAKHRGTCADSFLKKKNCRAFNIATNSLLIILFIPKEKNILLKKMASRTSTANFGFSAVPYFFLSVRLQFSQESSPGKGERIKPSAQYNQ